MNRSSQKILITLLTLSIIGVGLILPIQQANASLLNPFEWIGELPVVIFTAILHLILFFTTLPFYLVVWLLGAVISPFFISLSYTNPAGNPILEIGWTLTRDLANMGFVIALIYIGIATALRLDKIETKKTLVNLILIALLINFTPVICGVVVDASNIVMNFFLEGLTGYEGWARFVLAESIVAKTFIDGLKSLDITVLLPVIARILALIAFSLIASFVLFLFACLFIMRYVAIWTLVILSPLAFFCYVLPNTKSIFQQWWKHFLNWSFVGATAAFFLYLSQSLLSTIGREGGLAISTPSTAGGGVLGLGIINIEGLLNEILPFAVVVAFLIIGLLASIGIGAAGATQIITATKKGATKARQLAGQTGKWGAKATGKAVKETARGIPRIQKTEEKIMKRLEGMTVAGKIFGGRGAYIEKTQKRKVEASKRAKIFETPEDLREWMPKPTMIRGKTMPMSEENRFKLATGLNRIFEKGWATDADKDLIKYAQGYGLEENKMAKSMPQWAPEVGKNIEDVVKGAPPADVVKHYQKEAFENLDVFFAMDITQTKELGKKGSRDKKETLRQTVKTNKARIKDEIEDRELLGLREEAEALGDKLEEISNYKIY